MAVETILLSGLGTLLIALGYVLLKRFRRSHCSSHTACCDCDSPEITQMQQEHTERYDNILELITRIRPEQVADREAQAPPVGEDPVTLEIATSANSPRCGNPVGN